jgi:hypothetical protein
MGTICTVDLVAANAISAVTSKKACALAVTAVAGFILGPENRVVPLKIDGYMRTVEVEVVVVAGAGIVTAEILEIIGMNRGDPDLRDSADAGKTDLNTPRISVSAL